jgi:hypothetical protein
VGSRFKLADTICTLIENHSEPTLSQAFGNEKYGSIQTNILGIIEHLHYHLGQILVLKKVYNFGG